MEDNTIHKFNCVTCNKEVEVQSVYPPLIKQCIDCYLEEVKKGFER